MTCLHGAARPRVARGCPGGFSAFVPIPNEGRAASCRPIRSWPLGRRSGRFPPLPYPPPRSKGIVSWRPPWELDTDLRPAHFKHTEGCLGDGARQRTRPKQITTIRGTLTPMALSGKGCHGRLRRIGEVWG